jgi:hypothetical protein
MGLQTRQEFEAFMLQKVAYYNAARFLGRGKFHTLRADTLDELKKLIDNAGPQSRPWCIYAICPYHGIDHSIHLENYSVKKDGVG